MLMQLLMILHLRGSLLQRLNLKLLSKLFQDSVFAVTFTPGGYCPPYIMPAVFVPAPTGISLLVVENSATSVQEEPFQDSTLSVAPGLLPPTHKAFSALAPNPPFCILAVFKSPTSVQEDPFHSSVTACAGGEAPPKTKEAV